MGKKSIIELKRSNLDLGSAREVLDIKINELLNDEDSIETKITQFFELYNELYNEIDPFETEGNESKSHNFLVLRSLEKIKDSRRINPANGFLEFKRPGQLAVLRNMNGEGTDITTINQTGGTLTFFIKFTTKIGNGQIFKYNGDFKG